METFETYENSQQINANITFKSKAQIHGKIVFSLKKEDDLTDFIALNNNDNSTKINKEKTKTHNVFETVTHFALDSDQMPNKAKIIKDTLVKYSIYDKNSRKTYYSTFAVFPDEFKDGGSNVFRVIKRVIIVLNSDHLLSHKEFLKTLI